MARPLKICSQCLAFLRGTRDGEQDLSAYLMGIGAGGVEIVSLENCQARLTGHRETIPQSPPAGRSLADVTSEEMERAIASLITQLRLPAGHRGEAWDLENAVKAEWLKSLEARKKEKPGI